MKKAFKIALSIIGGISIMTGLQGCATANENPVTSSTSTTESSTGTATRTAEEAAVEAEFEPLFDFLAAEKKDFSNVESYVASINVINTENPDEHVDESSNRIILKPSKDVSHIEGEYIVSTQTNSSRYTIEYHSSDEKIILSDNDNLNINQSLLLPVLSDIEVIQNSEITSYSLDHSETELKQLSYKISESLEIFKILRETYDLPEASSTYANFSKSGNSEYTGSLWYKTEGKTYYISVLLIFAN